MNRHDPAQSAGAEGRRNRGSQTLLYALGGVMLVAGAGSWVWNRFVAGAPAEGLTTGEVMPGLGAADRIEAPHGALAGWNLLLVTFDTTRADHLACYGNRGVKTPTLDRLAREGILFANAVTPVPATLPAHCSLMTGLYPFNHGARANGTFRLDERNLTLAEMLREHGYRTGAAISAFVLDSSYGLDQGFEHYFDDLTRGVKHAAHMFRERPAELTNEVVSEWLRAHADQPFFCWVHYFDPHATYTPPEPFRSEYAANPYDGEIAYTDHQLGQLLSGLDELGVRDRTLVVMTADHGEGLGEHGEMTHSMLVHDATLHVPMIVHAPSALPRGKVIHRQVSLVDLTPTILDLLGIDPPLEVDGSSLLSEPPAERRACYIETLSTHTLHGWAPLLGVRREDYKYVLAPRSELYDLRKDPKELDNLYETHPELAREFQELLRRFVGEDPLLVARASENLEMSPEDVRKLAALGYVMTRPDDGATEFLMDPKDGVRHWERTERATQLRSLGDVKGAIEILEECLEEVPGDVWARQLLAGALHLQGRYAEAVEIMQAAQELSPNEPTIPLSLAAAFTNMGELDEAEAQVERARRIDPEHPPVYVQAAQIALNRRDPGEFLRQMDRALELDKGSFKPLILNRLGDFYMRRGEGDKAQGLFEEALEVDAFNGEAHGFLAEILIRQGRTEEAKQHLETAVRFNPAQPRALAVGAGLLIEDGQFEAAVRICERVIEMQPVFAPAYVNLGLAHRRRGDLAQAERAYREGIERCPPYDSLHQNLAQILLYQGRTPEAVEQFQAAVQVNPRNAVALVNLGIHHLQNARHEAARRFFGRALRVDPGYAFAHKHLGLLLISQGRQRRGVFHLQRSLELDPNQPDAGQIRFQLEPYEGIVPSPPSPEELEEDEADELNLSAQAGSSMGSRP